MKDFTFINFNIGNIGIKLSLHGFSVIRDKVGAEIHSHANFEYHFIINGNTVIQIDKNEFSLSKNSAILVFPNTFHKFVKSDALTTVLSLSFSIKRYKHGTNYYQQIQTKLTKKFFLLLEEDFLITDLIHQLISIVYSKNSKNLFLIEEINSRLTLLFINIFSKLTDTKNNTTNFAETQEYDLREYVIDDYFTTQYMQKISLEKLSHLLYLSTQQTARIIKKIYNTNFNNYLAKTRINHAKELILETDKSIVDISELVGYSSYPGFYSAFKKVTGMSPEKWREKFKKVIK